METISHNLHFSFQWTSGTHNTLLGQGYYCKYKSYPLQQLIIGSTSSPYFYSIHGSNTETMYTTFRTDNSFPPRTQLLSQVFILLCSLPPVMLCRLRKTDEVTKIPASWVQYHCWQCWHYRHTNKTVPPQINVDMFLIIRDSNQPGGFSDHLQ